MKKSVRLLPLTLFLALVAFGGDKRLTIEDALAIKQVGAPLFAPDGKRIAYTITTWDKKENRRVAHIWLVSSDGGRSVKLTGGDKGESAPQWSPDGTRIAFLADRGVQGGNQVWIIPADGGEAERLTNEENSILSFRWSPDSKQVAFTTRDTPKDKTERERRKKDRFDTITVDADYSFAHLWTIQVETKEKKRLTEGAFTAADPQWSPDGQWIAFTRSAAGFQESAFIDISDDRNTDICVIPAQGETPEAKMRQLTTNPSIDANPQWSPDSKWIAYIADNDPRGAWADKTDLLLIPVAGGEPRNITKSFFESVSPGITWSPDGQSLYFTSGVGVHTHLFNIATSGQTKPSQLTDESRCYTAFDVSADGRQLAYTVSDSFTPDDIWVASLKQPNGTAQARKITWANPELKDFAIAQTNVIKWKGPGNQEIEGLLIKPLGYFEGQRYPLILQIHGGPYARTTDTFNARAQIFAAHGYAVLLPNPRGSTGYGEAFAAANLNDWGGADFKDLMAGVDDVIARGIADPDKLVVMGGSYGGFMTFWTITQTDRFKAAIGHAGISDWYSFHGQSDIPGLMEYGFTGQPWTATESYRKSSPMSYVARVKTPLMITHGERDQRVNIQQAEQYYRALKKRGVEVVFYRYPREGHGIQEPNHVIDLVGRQLDWFDSHLGIKREGREKAAEIKAASNE